MSLHQQLLYNTGMMEHFQSKISSRLLQEGASLTGFADISDLPPEMNQSMNRALSIAVALDASIIGEISDGPTLKYFQEYRRVNGLLSELCHNAVDILHADGIDAVPIEPTIENLDYSVLSAPFPHKTAALRAGYGWIGKSALLITTKYGPAVRFATVLFQADCEVENTPQKSLCGTCNECVMQCPAAALTGIEWETGFERSMVYDAFACCAMAQKLSHEIGIQATICGICINVCPWTRKYIDS